MEIRDIRGPQELRAVEDLQKEVWRCDDREILPSIHMIAAREVGAILLGAFDGSDLVGFVYGFPGFEGEHRVIHSDMLAVRNAYRDRGLGSALKRAQREQALAQGIDRITWTFDPLQSRNAYVNFVHLGVIADRYLRDFYGETSSPLHANGTDRLWVTWHLHGRPQLRDGSQRIAMTDRQQMRLDFERAFREGLIATGFDRHRSEYILGRLITVPI